MILVISYPEDPHAQRVIGWLRERQEAVMLIDVSDFPEKATLTVEYADPCRPHPWLQREGEPAFDLRQVQAVWWRRPQAADVSAVTDLAARQFAANEWNEAIHGVWQLVEARWMNPPGLDEIASRKAYQLRIAAETGLRIPRTLITSSPEHARAFVDQHGLHKTIFKTFSATHEVWRETRLVREQELEILDTLRLAPAIFQEYVPAAVDLRVTVIGDRLFPAAIHAQGTDYPVDFRMSLGQARTEPAELPAPLVDRLLALMRRLGLVYGAIDMRRTPEGDYVFFEVNTAGEFLFIEERTGQPISQALAEWLATPSGP
jgi:glutathione synthase/RimK-type ligase-like ATP-grasp enzyme